MNRRLTITGGSMAVLGVMLLLLHSHDTGPPLTPAAAPVPADHAIEGNSIEVSASTVHPINAHAPGSSSDADPVASVIADLRRLDGIGPAAKGVIDERQHDLRILLTPANVAAVAHSLSPQELTSPIGTVVLERWVAVDPLAASAWIGAQPEATDHHAWLVAAALTRQPELLARFCEGLDHSSWSQAFLDHSGRELLRRSPAAAVSLAESLPPGERRMRLLETIACDWLLRDPDSARAWIDRVEDTDLRHRLVAVGAPSHASTDPLSALEWLLAQSPAEGVPISAAQTIARLWLHTADPETAVRLNQLLATFEDRRAAASRAP